MLNYKQQRMQRIIELMKEKYGENTRQYEVTGDSFRALIGCVLSHRTRVESAQQAARALFEVVESPEDVLQLGPEVLKEKIRCSGFYNQKARNILAICMVLIDEFGGVVPDDRAALISLPSVGPKTADIVLSHAFDRPAIAVDVHVATVASRLGLVRMEAKPEEIKEVLEGLVTPGRFRFVDNAFVRHGKEYCRSRNPRCTQCFLRALCENPRCGGDE